MNETTAMRGPEALLRGLLAVIPDGHRASSFFADDGVLDFPFLRSSGMATQYCGPAEIRAFFNFVRRRLNPGFVFDPQYIRFLSIANDEAMAGYAVGATVLATGCRVPSRVIAKLVTERGKIKLLRGVA